MKKFNLFLFPFAGGSKYSYNMFTQYCPEEINLIPIEIPGRGSRIHEALLSDISLIMQDLFSKIKNRLEDPYGIYGHSMGALIAFLMAHKIQEAQLPPPSFLFLTSRPAPFVKDDEIIRHSLPKSEFWKKLKEYGGFPEEILENNDLMDFFEPILRSDFKAIENYQYLQYPKLNIPINIMIGADEKVSLGDVLPWKETTTAKVGIKVLGGNHFFIFDHAPEIIKDIRSLIEETKNNLYQQQQ